MAAPLAHEYLNSFTNYEVNLHKLKGGEFDLSRINELLDILGHPQKDLKIIHVAGTKGKGSTCVFLANILAAAGCRVGLYTSPHLHRVNERIRVLDQKTLESADDFPGMISDEQLDAAVHAMRPHIAAMVNRGTFLTYFEVLTAAALYFFSRQGLDWVILETGLGGRLDATNTVDSLIAVVTPISIDHTKILGDTLAKIAAEKAGIIKNSHQRVVIVPQPPEAMDVLIKRCREFGIPPIVVSEDKYYAGAVALKGLHQRINASAAVCVVELLRLWGHKISDDQIAQGLKQVRWAGRFEVLNNKPVVIADAAHNADSARALAKTVLEEFPGRKVVLVMGTSSDKDVSAIAGEFNNMAATVILTKAAHPRAYAFSRDEAAKFFPGKQWSITENMQEALDLAMSKVQKNEVIVITGSIFIVAEAREKLCTNTDPLKIQ